MPQPEYVDKLKLPRHIAIIMDGNGRWAKKRGLPRIFGHRAGVKTVKKIVEFANSLGIRVLTLYAFSTENWARPNMEIRGLMTLLKVYLRREIAELVSKNVRLNTIGDIEQLPSAPLAELKKTIEVTRNNTGLILNLALNYGSRQEILRAMRLMINDNVGDADEKTFERYLYTHGLPDPDLLIRTSGEMRISNFLLWQTAYTEFYFTNVLWPDFTSTDLENAIIEYQKRERRFGSV